MTMRRALRLGLVLAMVGLAASLGAFLVLIPQNVDVRAADLPWQEAASFAEFPSSPPGTPQDLLFLHHSVGQQWLAEEGDQTADGTRHPNGGGLRARLTQAGYRVHEASYGSRLGEHTDLFDWLPKFDGHMNEVLRVANQDQPLPNGEVNRIVLFKSCFPNSDFVSEGEEPGSVQGPELTLANAKATFRALLPVFERHPRTLFVFVTTPPTAPVVPEVRLARLIWDRVRGKPPSPERMVRAARIARQFRDWVTSPQGWLVNYPLPNVVVFDYYGVLTGRGTSLFLKFPSRGGVDSHPSTEGNRLATTAFLPFLNRAVHRAKLDNSKILPTQ